jgi:hypothetical protein
MEDILLLGVVTYVLSLRLRLARRHRVTTIIII